MAYIARPPQIAMLSGLLRTPRHMMVGSMGIGKSGGLLLRAAAVEFDTGRWPGLVIVSPLQVAFNWAREIPLWLPDKRVSLVTGNEKQRRAALQKGADIYLLTYDNLPWVDQVLPNWSALGRMMVCDESTRIKHTRASYQTSSTGKRWLRLDGGVQTNALAKQAERFTYWVNATGTPIPNGPLDLWGQMWYIDGGLRLGSSYTAFENRWFRVPTRGAEFAKPEPLPGAVEEITQRVADVTTVVRIEDYAQIDEPNIVDRVVTLPAKARKVYDELKTEMMSEIQVGLETKTISVLSASAKLAKLSQVSSGFTYHGDEDDPEIRLCTELHTAKIDAVESILAETNEPLVVVYYFQATLDMLKRKFKTRLVELDAEGRVQDEWNAGRVEILAFQYRRGGLGLSLQHGGRNICLLSPTYRADDHAQTIERLGPLRQKQSGYDRTVNVFRIIAEGTTDRMIFNRVAEKMALQDMVIEALRGEN